jgi:hypothetical protein
MIRILAIAGALLGLASVAQADVWRWKDPNGTTHYSDNWVPGSVLVKTTAGESDSSSSDGNSSSSTPSSSITPSEAAQAERDKRTVAADVAKTKAEHCKQATENYQKAIESRRIYKEGQNGAREYLNDADADAYRARLLNERKQACGS